MNEETAKRKAIHDNKKLLGLVQEIHAASLRDRDFMVGMFSCDQLGAFVKVALGRCGQPQGKFATFFRVGNCLFLRANKEYTSRIVWFYEGWLAGKDKCDSTN